MASPPAERLELLCELACAFAGRIELDLEDLERARARFEELRAEATA